jgi:hypothetical protein
MTNFNFKLPIQRVFMFMITDAKTIKRGERVVEACLADLFSKSAIYINIVSNWLTSAKIQGTLCGL